MYGWYGGDYVKMTRDIQSGFLWGPCRINDGIKGEQRRIQRSLLGHVRAQGHDPATYDLLAFGMDGCRDFLTRYT